MKKAAIYARVSGEEQRQGTSLPSQVEECQRWAETNGYRVVKTVSHVFTASKSFPERSEARPLWAMLRAGHIDVIICAELDRFTRCDADITVLGEADDYGDGVRFVRVQYDRGSSGQFMRGIEVLVKQKERQDIAARMARGAAARWRNGELGTGKTPYGLTWDKESRTWGVDPKAAQVVRRIFNLYLDGESAVSIGDHLDDNGVQSSRARRRGERVHKRWPQTSVQYILANPRYAGLWPIEKHRVIIASPDVEIPDEYDGWNVVERDDFPVLISPADFRRVQRERRARRKTRGGKNGSGFNLLQGRIRCGLCGCGFRSRMHSSRGYKFYVCQGRESRAIREGKIKEKCTNPAHLVAEDLEVAVVEAVGDKLASPEGLKSAMLRYLDDLDGEIADLQTRLGPIVEEQKALASRKSRLARLYSDGMMSEDDYAREVQAIRDRESKLDKLADNRPEELARLKRLKHNRHAYMQRLEGMEDSANPLIEASRVSRWIARDLDGWDIMDYLGSGLIIDDCDVQVTVCADRLEVKGIWPVGGKGARWSLEVNGTSCPVTRH